MFIVFRCIRFWNTLTGQPLQCVDTGSQVCNLAWSKHANELVTQLFITSTRIIRSFLLAHLWGAYAIPLALSVVRRESSVVCRLCPP